MALDKGFSKTYHLGFKYSTTSKARRATALPLSKRWFRSSSVNICAAATEKSVHGGLSQIKSNVPGAHIVKSNSRISQTISGECFGLISRLTHSYPSSLATFVKLCVPEKRSRHFFIPFCIQRFASSLLKLCQFPHVV